MCIQRSSILWSWTPCSRIQWSLASIWWICWLSLSRSLWRIWRASLLWRIWFQWILPRIWSQSIFSKICGTKNFQWGWVNQKHQFSCKLWKKNKYKNQSLILVSFSKLLFPSNISQFFLWQHLLKSKIGRNLLICLKKWYLHN